MPLIIIFFIISIAEVYAFIVVGSEIGAFKTLLLCILTAIIGGGIVRFQGLETLMKAQQALMGGKMPLNEIFNGFCIVIAGVLLLTPGFVTDSIGFLLLFPPFRAFLQQYLLKNPRFHANIYQKQQSNDESIIIEGEYERVDKKPTPLEQNKKDD